MVAKVSNYMTDDDDDQLPVTQKANIHPIKNNVSDNVMSSDMSGQIDMGQSESLALANDQASLSDNYSKSIVDRAFEDTPPLTINDIEETHESKKSLSEPLDDPTATSSLHETSISINVLREQQNELADYRDVLTVNDKRVKKSSIIMMASRKRQRNLHRDIRRV